MNKVAQQETGQKMVSATQFGHLQRRSFDSREEVFAEIEKIFKLPAGERNAEIDKFIEARVQHLVEGTSPHPIGLFSDHAESKFIHPQSNIKPAALYAGYKMNDNDVYKMLITAIIDYKEAYPKNELPAIVPHAIFLAQYMYFGSYSGNDHARVALVTQMSVVDVTKDQDLEDFFSIADFKGKGIAVCLERAAAVHNMATFLGYQSHLINTLNFIVEGHEPSGHAFVVIDTAHGSILYDPLNFTSKAEDGEIVYRPGMYRLTAEQRGKLLTNGSVEVTVVNEHIGDDGKIVSKSTKLTYSGPDSWYDGEENSIKPAV